MNRTLANLKAQKTKLQKTQVVDEEEFEKVQQALDEIELKMKIEELKEEE